MNTDIKIKIINIVPVIIRIHFPIVANVLIVWLLLAIFLKYGINVTIMFIVLSNIASELTSIIIMSLFLPKKFEVKKEDIKPNKNSLKDILSISLPTTGSRIIGSIGYFFEPIILTFALLLSGYSNNYIINEYGRTRGQYRKKPAPSINPRFQKVSKEEETGEEPEIQQLSFDLNQDDEEENQE